MNEINNRCVKDFLIAVVDAEGLSGSHLRSVSAQRGRRAYYGTSIDLITRFRRRRLQDVVDEIDYLPINHSGAVLLFQLINHRYERASRVLTSNKVSRNGVKSSAMT